MSQRKFERAARQRRDAERRRRSARRRRSGLAAGAVSTAVLFAPAAASAAEFEVDKLTDAAPVAGACTAAAADCTLREAIAEANANALAEDDNIVFADSLTFPGTITLNQGQLTINSADALEIEGPGASQLSVSGNDESRVFDIAPGGGDVSISGLKVIDGDGSADAGNADIAGAGGAIRAQSPLDLTDSVVTGSTATSGGGLATAPGTPAVVDDTDFTGNEAAGRAGGIRSAGPLTLVDSTISGNTSTGGGGGVSHGPKYAGPFSFGAGELAATDSTIAGNSATNGGGILIDASEPKYGDPSDVSLLRTTVSGNSAENGAGGGIDFVNTIEGTAVVSNSTVANNTATTLGGGIHAGAPEPVLERRSEAANRAEGDGTLNVDNTTVAANDATRTGGGIALEDDATEEGSVGLSSTIVGDNSAGSADKDLSTTDDGFTSEHSLIEVPNAAVGTDPTQPTIFSQDPQLGALANNGGPTQTKLPAGSSPAIDKGNNDDSLTEEQRHTARTVDLATANATGGDGTDVGAVEIASPPVQGIPPATTSNPPPVTPSATPTICGRRAISLVRADVRGSKVKLTGLVGAALYGKKVTIQTDPKGARNSAFTRTTTVTASRTGAFTATVAKPKRSDFVSVRYRAVSGRAKSPSLKLPQSLTSRSVKSDKGTITVKGRVKKSVLGKRNRVKIRRLVCGRYRTVGTAKPDKNGKYTVTFAATQIRGVSFYRAESMVLRKRGSKVYVIQYARAIAIRTTSQTG